MHFKQLKRRNLKIFRLERESNPWFMVHGSIPVQAWIFFQVSSFQLLKLKHLRCNDLHIILEYIFLRRYCFLLQACCGIELPVKLSTSQRAVNLLKSPRIHIQLIWMKRVIQVKELLYRIAGLFSPLTYKGNSSSVSELVVLTGTVNCQIRPWNLFLMEHSIVEAQTNAEMTAQHFFNEMLN